VTAALVVQTAICAEWTSRLLWGAESPAAVNADREPDRPHAANAERQNPGAGPAAESDAKTAGQRSKPKSDSLPTGRLIRIPLPITDAVSRAVEASIREATTQLRAAGQGSGGSRPILVLQIEPSDAGEGQGSKFPAALAIATELTSREMAEIKTVGYLPRPVKGHAVLVAMACEEIVMAPDAELGEAAADQPDFDSIGPVVRAGYQRIADLRRTIPTPVALGMLDPELEVWKVELEVSLEFCLSDELEELRRERTIKSESILFRRGEAGRLSGREARSLGFAKYLAEDRDALARELGLPPESLQEDPLLGRPLEPRMVEVAGPITAPVVNRLESMINDLLRGGNVNFLCVRINSPGGALTESLTLANYLAGLDSGSVRTVAYVPNEARADAALIAMACDQLVIHPEAVIGGEGPVPTAPRQIEAARISIENLVRGRGDDADWSPVVALIDPEMAVHAYRDRESGEVRYWGDREAAERAADGQWERLEPITEKNKPLELTGRQAEQYGLASHVVTSFDELKDRYGLTGDPRIVEPGWADFLVEALASPGVAMFLLVLGGAGLYAELQAPGHGIGGFLASVSFLLFFWSKFLHGTSDWLEVVLFLGGVTFLLLEVFVLPGFGIFGLGGGLMVIASLVLASQTFVIPQTTAQLAELRDSMLVVAGAGAGIIAAATVIRRFLARTPLLNRLLLNPVQGEELNELGQKESLVRLDHLLGQRGVAVTILTPAGKARFGNELVDVIADGELIDRLREVEVVEVRGNHVLVRSVG
jgi:membrane-bound ClpP family serine protease